MRFLVVLLALLAVGVLSGPAAAAGDPTSAQAAALDRLQAASSTPVAADFEDGIARYVSGTVPADGASATERALSFLDRFRDLYGLSEPRSQLQVVRQAGEGDAQDVFFGESVRGVPVENAQLAVHLLGGAVVSTNGAYLPVLPAAMKPAVTAAKAVAAAQSAAGIAADPVVPPALAYFNAGLTMTAVEREIWHLDDATHLVWRVTLPTRVSYVDAFSGRELLGLRPAVDAATSLRIGSANGGSSVLGGCWFPGATNWFDENGVVPGGTPDAEGTAAFGFANTIYDYFRNTFGRRSFDGNDHWVSLTLDVSTGQFGGSNAAYVPWCNNDIEVTNNMATKDILAHEFTHGVTDFTAHLAGSNQPGALNEHYSDFFAAMIDPANWTIGEGSALGVIRDMSNPPTRGQPDNMGAFVQTFVDNGGVHVNNGIPNKVAFLVTDGGLHRGFQIRGIGRSKTQQLWFNVLTTQLTSAANFNDQRNLTVGLASQWAGTGTRGFTATDACTVRNAFASVGLGDGDADCNGVGDAAQADDDVDGLSDTMDNCPKVANPSQADADRDGLGDACDPDDDNDNVLDAKDNCVLVPNPAQTDTDRDGLGDACDPTPSGDNDGDGVDNLTDNCPGVPNVAQADGDRDGIGDACDNDFDNDGIQNAVDNCPLTANSGQQDTDKDGVGDACDNAPTDFNPDQADTDGDGIPDVIDPDDDNDGVLDAVDNCPLNANPRQEISACLKSIAPQQFVAPGTDVRAAFIAPEKYFEPYQILVVPCLQRCGAPGDVVKTTLHVDSELPLELRVLDPRGEPVASGVSTEPLTFEAAVGEDGLALHYRLEIVPSPEFEAGREYPFTAGISEPRF